MSLLVIPSQYESSAIATVLRKYAAMRAVKTQEFIETILQRTTLKEVNEVCRWMGWDSKEIERICQADFKMLDESNARYVATSLHCLGEVVLMRAELRRKHPNCSIELSPQATPPLTHWKPSIKWFRIIGQDGSLLPNP